MPSILVVDDRKDMRSKVVGIVDAYLPAKASWKVRDLYPLQDISGYVDEIHDNDVAVIILDELLHEQENEITGFAVDYNGHDVAEHIRSRMPDFPIFIVPAVSDTDDLREAASKVEDVISRKAFLQSPDTFVQRIIRAGARFSSAQQESLSMLSKLSEKAASATLTNEERETMNSIRERLAMAAPADASVYSSELLPKAEQLIKEARELVARLTKK